MNRSTPYDRSPFNTAFETGIRSLAILVSAYPRSFDLPRLVVLDHLVVHTGDVGGPRSLHPALPMRSAALLVRRPVVERGLLLMMSRGLTERTVGLDGISYRAGEFSETFVQSLASPYILALRERAQWVSDELVGLDDDAFRHRIHSAFGDWLAESDSNLDSHSGSTRDSGC